MRGAEEIGHENDNEDIRLVDFAIAVCAYRIASLEATPTDPVRGTQGLSGEEQARATKPYTVLLAVETAACKGSVTLGDAPYTKYSAAYAHKASASLFRYACLWLDATSRHQVDLPAVKVRETASGYDVHVQASRIGDPRALESIVRLAHGEGAGFLSGRLTMRGVHHAMALQSFVSRHDPSVFVSGCIHMDGDSKVQFIDESIRDFDALSPMRTATGDHNIMHVAFADFGEDSTVRVTQLRFCVSPWCSADGSVENRNVMDRSELLKESDDIQDPRLLAQHAAEFVYAPSTMDPHAFFSGTVPSVSLRINIWDGEGNAVSTDAVMQGLKAMHTELGETPAMYDFSLPLYEPGILWLRVSYDDTLQAVEVALAPCVWGRPPRREDPADAGQDHGRGGVAAGAMGRGVYTFSKQFIKHIPFAALRDPSRVALLDEFPWCSWRPDGGSACPTTDAAAHGRRYCFAKQLCPSPVDTQALSRVVASVFLAGSRSNKAHGGFMARYGLCVKMAWDVGTRDMSIPRFGCTSHAARRAFTGVPSLSAENLFGATVRVSRAIEWAQVHAPCTIRAWVWDDAVRAFASVSPDACDSLGKDATIQLHITHVGEAMLTDPVSEVTDVATWKGLGHPLLVIGNAMRRVAAMVGGYTHLNLVSQNVSLLDRARACDSLRESTCMGAPRDQPRSVITTVTKDPVLTHIFTTTAGVSSMSRALLLSEERIMAVARFLVASVQS